LKMALKAGTLAWQCLKCPFLTVVGGSGGRILGFLTCFLY